MKSVKSLLQEIFGKLDELIKIAQELKDQSKQVVSEKDIYHLQEHQEQLLKEIIHLDHELEPFYKTEMKQVDHDLIHQKIEEFKKLNEVFVNNLTSQQGVIQFNSLKETEEEGDVVKPYRFALTKKQNTKPKK